jgi:hypothetical protein
VKLVFEPSGTHWHKGQLKGRLDLFPEPLEKSYAKNYVYVPVVPEGGYTGKVNESGQPIDQKAYDKWLASLPHIWQLNPCLSIFVGIDENTTKTLFDEFIKDTYTKDVLATIDNIMSSKSTPEQPHLSAHLISPYARGKTTLSSVKSAVFDEQTKNFTNQRLGGINLLLPADGKAKFITPQSIDVGPGATNRAAQNIAGYTFVFRTNPSNGTGIIDTMQAYFNQDGTGLKLGTFTGSSTSYTPHDVETIGNVTSGSEQTYTGKNCDVTIGDFLGCFYATGYIDWTVNPGGSGVYYKVNDQFGAGTQSYTLDVGSDGSIYATGTDEVVNTTVNSAISIGVLSVASRIAGFKRIASLIVGIVATASRAWGKRIVSAVSIGVIATASRIFKAIRISGSLAASQGPNSPGTMADDDSVGTSEWIDYNNAKVSDNVYAYSDFWTTTHYLKASNFSFSIPIGAVINGIKVEIERKRDGDGNAYDEAVKLVKADGSIGSENKADTVNSWQTSDTYKSYGGVSDLWGETLTPTDINDADFGVVLQADFASSDEIARVDHIRITVYYSTGDGVTVGVATTASHIIGLHTLASVIIGIATSATKSFGTSVLSSVSIGISATAMRLYQSIRNSSVIVGVVTAASRIFKTTVLSSVIIGIVASASRAWGVRVASAISIGVTATSSKIFGAVKTSAVSIGVLTTALRLKNIIITASVAIGVVVSATKGWAARVFNKTSADHVKLGYRGGGSMGRR